MLSDLSVISSFFVKVVWRFPKIGVPLNHPFLDWDFRLETIHLGVFLCFSLIVWGTPWLWKPPELGPDPDVAQQHNAEAAASAGLAHDSRSSARIEASGAAGAT